MASGNLGSSGRNDVYGGETGYDSNTTTGRGSDGLAASDQAAAVRGREENNPDSSTGTLGTGGSAGQSSGYGGELHS